MSDRDEPGRRIDRQAVGLRRRLRRRLVGYAAVLALAVVCLVALAVDGPQSLAVASGTAFLVGVAVVVVRDVVQGRRCK